MTSPQKPVDYYYRHYEYQSHPAQPLSNSPSNSSLASSPLEHSPSHAQSMYPYVYDSQGMYRQERAHSQPQLAVPPSVAPNSAQLATPLPAQLPPQQLASPPLATQLGAQPAPLAPPLSSQQLASQLASQHAQLPAQPLHYRKDSVGQYQSIAPSRSQPVIASHVQPAQQMHQPLIQSPKSHGQVQSGAGYNGNYNGQQFAYIPATPQPTRRRSVPKLAADISYPVNYPAHAVPPHMRVATGPPNSWTVMPPRPEDIRTRRYASGVDERNFFSVLEYEINSQAIIWDYYTGYVHLTGIWKAIGNSKADIVKLLDNSPELEPVIKRVRGGFLKIQGTWVPYDVARRLAIHVCYYVRYALVPLFGADFPEQCTKPHEPMFGLLQLTMPPKKEGPSKAPRPFQSQHPVARSSESPNSYTQPITSVPVATTPTTPMQSLLASTPVNSGNTPAVITPGTSVGVPVSAYSPPAKHAHLHVLPHNHSHHHSHNHHSRRQSDSGFKRRSSFNRSRTNSLTAAVPIRKDLVRKSSPVNSELYDENVFEDEDAECVSPPPMPRKVSFSDEQRVSGSPSEFLAMLKATRSLQQMSTGRPVKDTGGDFECAGRQFVWDGSDRLDMLPFRTASTSASGSQAVSTATSAEDLVKLKQSEINESLEVEPKKPEPTPPMEPVRDRRLPSLATILNV